MILFKIINNKYIDTWQDYSLGASYRNGARWNSPRQPVLYFAGSVQNAMLEISRYSITPTFANNAFTLVAFQFPEISLYELNPKDLPGKWNTANFPKETQKLGDAILGNNEYHGFRAPSAAINISVVEHSINAVRTGAYQNIIINPESIDLSNVTIVDKFKPIFCNKMFENK